MTTRLILASASPRRRELLALLRLPFDVVPSDVDETLPADRMPPETAVWLARSKAEAVMRQAAEDAGSFLVLGADTIVVCETNGGAEIRNKPADPAEAGEMLRQLSGRTHTVLTGLCLAARTAAQAQTTLAEVVATQVTFRPLTEEMIAAYLATGEPFDKAGGYGIQGYASTFVTQIVGDYFNVVGLPVQTVARMLERAGIAWWRGADALKED